ncbi:MAG: hypothetical protein PHY50_07190 [Sideroxydans sp.]|nr:hypothetical protein [Sideroxydans sp.]
MHPIIQSWLLQSGFILLSLGSLAGIAVGALLVFRPGSVARLSGILDRWVSTRRIDRALERNITLDPWFYRHRILTGSLLILGALFVLYYFTAALDRGMAIQGLSQHFSYPPQLTEGLLDALVMSALLGSLSAIIVALFIMFRPSLLKASEEEVNRWISLRKALKPAEISRDNLNRFVGLYAKQTGIFLILGGIYTIALLSWYLVG